MEEETVTISKAEYQSLQESQDFLDCLEAVGVDNWNGVFSLVWDEAREMFREGQ